MSPKSRLYTLVKAWKNKPFQEVRDACGQPWLGLSGEALEEHQSWSQRQAISNEPIFNNQGTKRVIAWQISEGMSSLNLSKTAMAKKCTPAEHPLIGC